MNLNKQRLNSSVGQSFFLKYHEMSIIQAIDCELHHFTHRFSIVFEEEYEEPYTVEDLKSIRAGGLTIMMNLKCEPFSNCL